jgi:hypothetical protein
MKAMMLVRLSTDYQQLESGKVSLVVEAGQGYTGMDSVALGVT